MLAYTIPSHFCLYTIITVSLLPTLSTAPSQGSTVSQFQYIRPSISSKLSKKIEVSSRALAPDISTGSQSSVVVVVGVTVGAAVALLTAVSVLGVGVLVVWRRNTSKPALQPAIVANGNADHKDNPAYGGRYSVGTFHMVFNVGNSVLGNGNGIHSNMATQQQQAPSSSCAECDSDPCATAQGSVCYSILSAMCILNPIYQLKVETDTLTPTLLPANPPPPLY